MDEEEMGAFMEEWLTARLGLSKPGPWHNSGDRYAECTTVPADVSWLSKNLHRIRSVVNEILAFFNVELPQFDNDNCWFFLHPDSKPKNWGWGRCLQLCFERRVRCGTWCNRHDITIDTPDTIYICVIKCEIQAGDHNAELKEHYKKKYEDSRLRECTMKGVSYFSRDELEVHVQPGRFDDHGMDEHISLHTYLIKENNDYFDSFTAWRFDDSEMNKHVVLRSFLVDWDSDYFEDGDDGFRFDTKDYDHESNEKKSNDDEGSIKLVNQMR
ncbi:hypothetical protein D6C85_03319 [Aureobasidium pullulans]|uniref:Uncharacterized protein n=1 Tax=Aureobasidium pullulans TaxID=5580 RepID=A0A4S9XA98_AURPU|nr:hypothetical protein D6C85_03319 [Aureobasidium pullulans]